MLRSRKKHRFIFIFIYFQFSIFMATGTVKWFNGTKGFGFIQPDGGGADAFVHISAVQKAGLTTLNENAKVSYDLEESKGKVSAANIKLI